MKYTNTRIEIIGRVTCPIREAIELHNAGEPFDTVISVRRFESLIGFYLKAGRVTLGNESPGQSAPPPGPLTRAVSFARAVGRHVADGGRRCTQPEIDVRLAICQPCEHYRDSACRQCGCKTVREQKFLNKLAWASEKCPIGKWSSLGTRDDDASPEPLSESPETAESTLNEDEEPPVAQAEPAQATNRRHDGAHIRSREHRQRHQLTNPTV